MSYRLPLLLLLGVVGVVAAGCGSDPVVDGGAIVGTVVDGSTGLPLPNATVRCGSSATSTDAHGRFYLGDLPTGPATVTATAAAYQPSAGVDASIIGQTVSEVSVRLVPDETESAPATAFTPEPRVVEVVSSGTVSGTIIDAHDGVPVPGAWVHLADGPASCTSSETGTYRLASVPAGGAEVVYATRGYREERRAVDVNTDGEAVIDVPLVAPETGEIVATARNVSTGAPLAGVEVTTEPLRRSAVTLPDGDARISHVPAGEYTLLFHREDFGQATAGLVHVDSIEWPHVTSGLAPTLGGLVGTLSDVSGRPLAGWTLLLSGLTTTSLTTDDTGRFELRDVPLPADGVAVELTPQGGRARAHATLRPGVTEDAGPLRLVR
jgi:hypothetical protein